MSVTHIFEPLIFSVAFPDSPRDFLIFMLYRPDRAHVILSSSIARRQHADRPLRAYRQHERLVRPVEPVLRQLPEHTGRRYNVHGAARAGHSRADRTRRRQLNTLASVNGRQFRARQVHRGLQRRGCERVHHRRGGRTGIRGFVPIKQKKSTVKRSQCSFVMSCCKIVRWSAPPDPSGWASPDARSCRRPDTAGHPRHRRSPSWR